MPFSPIAAINAATSLFWLALALAVAYALYWLYEHVYKPFMDTDSASFKANERNITNFFTPHSDDGSVAPKDVAPAGTDPVDWLFMQHDDPS